MRDLRYAPTHSYESFMLASVPGPRFIRLHFTFIQLNKAGGPGTEASFKSQTLYNTSSLAIGNLYSSSLPHYTHLALK